MMKQTMDNGLMTKKQCSIMGKKSISNALNKTLLFDNLRYQKVCLSLTSCDLNVDIDAAKVPICQECDQPLMDKVLAANLDPATIQIVNYCRMYLKIFTIADMTTGYGREITDNSWLA